MAAVIQSSPAESVPVTEAEQSPAAARFHLSLNVSDIDRLVEFFQRVFGVAPAKHRSDYAKFELDFPPLVLSLEPGLPGDQGSFNHAGFRFATVADLVSAQERLEAAGISTQREDGVECCYARQTKFWVHDPDGRLWEFYVLDGDIDHRGQGQTMDQMTGHTSEAESAGRCSLAEVAPQVYEHRMGSEVQFPATACDEILLRGTFNVPVTDLQIINILQQAFETLRPGGHLELHVLTCESAIEGDLNLPGPAACVTFVPVRSSLMQFVTDAGFMDQQLITFRSGACFQADGQALRETKVRAAKPSAKSSEQAAMVALIYRGPFAEIKDDEGYVWRRGIQVSVSAWRWHELQEQGLADNFTVIPETVVTGTCGV
ncbi:MAG: ArsI/CadI family heavy metal resistance metalloenzyme [Planctomycetaceae bacterium]